MSSPIKDEWTSKDGQHRIILGDCLEVLKALDTSEVAAVVTDPPFGLGKKLCGGTWGAKYRGGLSWDSKPANAIQEIVDGYSTCIVWGGNYFQLPPGRCWLVWWKPDAVQTMADAELAWTNIDGNTRVLRHSIAATNAERGLHETQKPLRVMEWSVGFTPHDCTVLDPYAGSCTVAVACARTGRRSLSIEIEEKYFRIGIERMEREAKRMPLFEPKPVQRNLL